MEFKILTPYEFAELTAKSPSALRRKALRDRPMGTPPPRSHGLNCYVPDGQAQASRRVTGAHLDPDSPQMFHAAMTLAGSLLDALGHGGQPARILISPASYSDKVLAKYCQGLAKAAFGAPSLDLLSPALVPYLLGGITHKGVEELAHRALEVMEFFPEPLDKSKQARWMNLVGFGSMVPHIHVDSTEATLYGAKKKTHSHLSHRQEYLLRLPVPGSYARHLIDRGAYDDLLCRTLTGFKAEILDEAQRLLDPAGGEMTEFAAKDRQSVELADRSMLFARAVRRVFEKPWAELDLSGDNGDRFEDLEVLIARLIIQRLSHKVLKSDKLSATTLVGMSLLTGVSVANWAQFAVYDLRRRGETFLTADTLDEVVSIIEVSPHFNCEQELRGAAVELRYGDIDRAKWARRLQSPNRPLWSRNSKFYQNGIDLKGFPTYTHKPFSLSRD